MEALVTVLVGVGLAAATAFFTAKAYVHQATADLKNEFHRRFNDRRWPSYLGFAATIRDVLKQAKVGTVDAALNDRIFEFMGELWIVGSDDVILAFLRWRASARAFAGGEATNREHLTALAGILVAMRRDLGETDTKIGADHLLATFIDDILVELSDLRRV